MKRALLIAFHFPPIRQSSGLQRTLKFSRYLLDHGWQSIVLTVHPRVYDAIGDDQLGDIPDDIIVHRAFAVDAKRHLSIRGRYLDFTARPDRYGSWILGGVWAGQRLIRRHHPAVIWSTYPIASAHVIGRRLHLWSGIPWVADFRDPMTQPGFPVNLAKRARIAAIEARTVSDADRLVFTTPGARDMYVERYPDVPDNRWCVIPNGFDEAVFAEVRDADPRRDGAPIQLLHSGTIYPHERDPRPFFNAISALKKAGDIGADRFRIRLRATGHDAFFASMLAELAIDDIVELAPAIDYRDALAEMMSVDGLLLFQQSAGCNHQVPAKVYEYFRARRPIFALTEPAGDTAAVMREAGLDAIVSAGDEANLQVALLQFLEALRDGTARVADEAAVTRYSRHHGAGELARLLDEVSLRGG